MSENFYTLLSFENNLSSSSLVNDERENQGMNNLWKILSLFIILALTLIFGLMPSYCKKCLSPRILGIANAFSGGIFMGIALFHLLPESIENVDEFLKDSDSIWKKIPLPYFLAFLSYSLILFVEKIAFDSHALIEHDHDHGGKHTHAHSHTHDEQELKSNKNKEISQLSQNLIENNEKEDSDSDLEEEALKNVVSSRGKFASFMQMRNSIIDGNKHNPNIKPDKALLRASQILEKTLHASHLHEEDDDMKYMVNPKNVHVDEEKVPQKEISQTNTTCQANSASNLTPFLLLIALSLHGFFEGLALGIQSEVKDTLFLAGAILAHKWAEAFTLGISFTKANIPRKTLIIMISIFAIFTPMGIGLGLILSETSKIVEGIILALSTGTFIYVAASEVIVEEFAVTKYRYSKFLTYLVGGVFVGILAVIEKLYGDE